MGVVSRAALRSSRRSVSRHRAAGVYCPGR
jgi:hypothetical protein